jgi:hypothetical protein
MSGSVFPLMWLRKNPQKLAIRFISYIVLDYEDCSSMSIDSIIESTIAKGLLLFLNIVQKG